MSLHAVVSIEAGTPTEWQAALLAYSWSRAGIRTPLTVLSSGGLPSEPIEAEIVTTPNYRYTDGGDYSPWNRPCSLRDWLDEGLCPEENVLILDPDFLILEPLPLFTPSHQAPIGERFPSDTGINESAVRVLTPYPQYLQSVGVPVWITKDDLVAMLPIEIDHLAELRSYGLPFNHWVAEMTAYDLASADLGFCHQVVEVACGPSIIHYFGYRCGIKGWHKHTYTPWEPPPPLNPDANLVARQFHAILSEYAALRRAAP